MSAGTVLVARLDNAGDVLLQGPLVRAVAAGADRVVFLRDGRVVDQTSPPAGPESLVAPGRIA